MKLPGVGMLQLNWGHMLVVILLDNLSLWFSIALIQYHDINLFPLTHPFCSSVVSCVCSSANFLPSTTFVVQLLLWEAIILPLF